MTAPADKPASLREILEDLQTYAWNRGRGTYDMSDDTKVDEAIAAITALVPEKHEVDWQDIGTPELIAKQSEAYGFNEAIDAIHRNFNGQPQGDKEQA